MSDMHGFNISNSTFTERCLWIILGQTEIEDEYDPYHTTLLVDMSLLQK